jgi:hypothetical protein
MPIVSYGDKAIDLHMNYGAQLPTMHLYPINGADHRVDTSETSFSFRDANFAEVILGVDLDPANNERMIGWARDLPIPTWRMLGLTISQRSMSCFRQKKCARATKLTLGFTVRCC